MSEIYKVSIALTGKQIGILRGVVGSGLYATTSEVVREAIREWQQKHHHFKAGPKRKAAKRKIRKHIRSTSKRRKIAKRKRKL